MAFRIVKMNNDGTLYMVLGRPILSYCKKNGCALGNDNIIAKECRQKTCLVYSFKQKRIECTDEAIILYNSTNL